ncbi:hypothetical protein UlMin_008998, partial [Ulmus minor]
MGMKRVNDVGVENLVKTGLGMEEAKVFERILKDSISGAEGADPREVWRRVVAERILKPWHPHELHQLVYYSVYTDWDVSTKGLPLYWFPSL